MEVSGMEEVRIVVADPSLEVRKSLKSALYSVGFRNITDTERVSVVREAVNNDQIDLLIGDGSMGECDLCKVTREVRDHKLGTNPFVTVIILVSDPTRDHIMKVVDSGADDLIAKPITMGMLIRRVAQLTKHRKRFVVTTGYTGPDRRKEDRPGTEIIPKINVPNPLEAKTATMPELGKLQVDIDEVTQVLNERKMERHGVQIAWLIDRIAPLYQVGLADDSIVGDLKQLVFTVEDLARRLGNTRGEPAIDLCRAMVRVVHSINEDPLMPSNKDVGALKKMAEAVLTIFSPAEENPVVSPEIAELVRKWTA